MDSIEKEIKSMRASKKQLKEVDLLRETSGFDHPKKIMPEMAYGFFGNGLTFEDHIDNIERN